MAIVVTTPPPGDEYAPDEVTFTDATKWVIDDAEMLHIVGRDGNLASYNRGAWTDVRKTTQPAGIKFNGFTDDPEELAKRREKARKDALTMGGLSI